MVKPLQLHTRTQRLTVGGRVAELKLQEKKASLRSFPIYSEIKWLWYTRHLWHKSMPYKSFMNWRVFSLFPFPFFHVTPFSKGEMVDKLQFIHFVSTKPPVPQMCQNRRKTEGWRQGDCAPLVCSMGPWSVQSLLEGETGPLATLLQAAATKVEKQMLYELKRAAEEEKKSLPFSYLNIEHKQKCIHTKYFS